MSQTVATTRSPDLLSIDDAAVLLGMSRAGTYDLARRGELPGACRLGSRWRVSRPALLRYLHGDAAAAVGAGE